MSHESDLFQLGKKADPRQAPLSGPGGRMQISPLRVWYAFDASCYICSC